MKNYRLEFASVLLHSDNMAEIIIDEGIEIDLLQINEFQEFFFNNLLSPFLILINNKNSFSYSFRAQRAMGTFDDVKATAVLIGTNGGLMSAETLINMSANSNWNVKVFQKREEALEWLQNEQSVHNTSN